MMASLRSLLSPRSIAIVGASENPSKVSGRPLKHLLSRGYKGAIYPVNPKYEKVQNLTCYPSIASLPEVVDLAVVVVPARDVEAAIFEAGQKGIPAAVIFSSGFSEMGEEGRDRERRLIETARAGGVRICGPNCLGLINTFENVFATFSQYADEATPAGPVGFVTQSGAFGTAIAALARNRGLGLGYFVNTGNQADVDFVQIMREVLSDPRIKVGAGYIEGLKDGKGLIELAKAALEMGKPLVLTKVGRTAAGARAAASHTGSLAGEDAVFDGVLRQFGVIRARNEEHMLDIVEVLVNCPLPNGNGIGVLTQSGGAGVLMADRAEEFRLKVPQLLKETQSSLQRVLPGFGTATNPVDVTGQFVANPAMLRDSALITLSDPQIHVGVIWLQLMEAHVDVLVSLFQEIKAATEKPLVVCWVAAPDAAIRALHEGGIPVLRGAEPTIDALAPVISYANARREWLADRENRVGISLPSLELPPTSGAVATIEANEVLKKSGVATAPTSLAATAQDAVRAAERHSYPVAVKIESPDILHKSEAGGVRIGLRDAEQVSHAFQSIIENATKHLPNARLSGVVVQPLVRGDVEFVIGLQNDPVFGVVLMAGLGGILVETLKDVAFRKVPLTPKEAKTMLNDLRGRPILDGVRGRPPVDQSALIDLICAVSRFGAVAEPRLKELDLNPIMLNAEGAVAVDWLMILN